MAKAKKDTTIWTSGRRKTAVARIKLEAGTGAFVINDRLKPEEYFPTKLDVQRIYEPFAAVGRDLQGFDISVKLSGSGKKAQVDAMRLGFAKALVKLEPNLRPILKTKGFLTRDPRMKERKKYGLKKARKAPQFSKR